jgi:choline dehydrogenase
MVHMRGCPADYDGWAAAGCTGWDYESVLPAFMAIEDFADGDLDYHAQDGRLRVAIPESVNPLSQAAMAAALDVGYPYNPDLNGMNIDGVGWNQLAIRDGQRESAAAAFLRSALARPNLTVLTGALVTQLVVRAGRVCAIDYLIDNQTRRDTVGNEAVLCAGVVESPKILMLSGIGPVEHLESLGIRVAVESPGVGANLHDHPGVGVTFRAKREIPPGVNQGSELGLFARLDRAAPKPQVQFGLTHVPYYADGFFAPANSFTFFPSWTTPESRGRLTLRSASPTDPPAIDPRYLSEDSDLRGLIGAIELSREMAHASGLREWTDVEVIPGPGVSGGEMLRAYVRQAVDTWFHAVGTCRMGSDEDAVVDTSLRVRGVANLRVIDASVIPTVPTGNTNAPTLMIAERGSALMLDDA